MAILLNKENVAQVLNMHDCIDILETAFSDLSKGKAEMPQRTPIFVPNHNGLALFMPAYIKGMGAIGAKIVTVYKDNPSKYELPNVLGTIILLDEKTGKPIALMDGGYLTAMRTGAVAGLATRSLARVDARVHTLIGTGGMAKAQALGVDCARDISKLVLFSMDEKEKQEEFRKSLMEHIGCEIVIADNAKEACLMGDIVTLITSAKDPIVQASWFKPGTHINGMGSHAPLMRELDAGTLKISKVICDLVDACVKECGDFIIPVQAGEYSFDELHGSLGDVISKKTKGRESDDEITLFKSVGLAIQDISTAHYVYQKASELKVGMNFEF